MLGIIPHHTAAPTAVDSTDVTPLICRIPPPINIPSTTVNNNDATPDAPRSTLRVIAREKQVNIDKLHETTLSFRPDIDFKDIAIATGLAIILTQGHDETPWKIYFNDNYSRILDEVPAGSILHLDESNNVVIDLAGSAEPALITE